MKVEICRDRLLIVPETNFEIDWIHSKFEIGVTHKAWLRTGLSASDLLGIIVAPDPTTIAKEPDAAQDIKCTPF